MFDKRDGRFNTAIILLAVAIVIVGIWGFKSKRDRESNIREQLLEASETQSELSLQDEEKENPKFLYVDICGAVAKEGFYELPFDSRVYDAVQMAGGLLENADTKRINLAQKVYDQQKIIIPAFGDGLTEEETEDGLININTASKALLEDLPGIGPAYAERIVEYRQKNGGFKSKEELMEIKGIGEKTYAGMEECFCIY
ncbi:MAG TPA: ComEA family DNA-binding protein [Clostridia bacterium]|nr:ComEA family DNA-binding protein [Clostridia bacterium]